MRISIANVLNLLRAAKLSTNIVVTRIAREEQELHDALRDIIARAQEQPMLAFETEAVLEYEGCAASHEPQFVEPRSEYDEDYEHEGCVPQEAGIIIDIEYKRRTVDYWNAKSKRRALESVQHRFKKVQRWEEGVYPGGSNRDKMRYITEYVLIKFKGAMNTESVTYDIRRSSQVGFACKRRY
ncbi:hypothetical protein Trydic_g6094 [Trypoxylus dichotomus]